MKLQRKSGVRALTIGAVAISSALVLTACGSDDNAGGTDASASTSSGSIECADKAGQILSSGSSAQQNAMDLWVQKYQAACSGATVNYKASSSGEGIIDFNQGTDAFAGSDSPLKPEEIAESKKICTDGTGISIPMVGGPIAIGYNLSGVDSLVLDATTLGNIFNSKITYWDDDAIKALNDGVSLPHTKIQAFHRQDESGTTDNLTKYLSAADPKAWPYEHAKAFAGKGGQSAAKSAGVAAQVKQTNGSIGYFEVSYATANSIKTAAIDTGASAPVEATAENASAGIASGKVVGTGSDLSLDLSSAYTTKADNAYPIVLVTYEIACDKGNKAATLPLMKSFLTYTASEEGQALLADAGYAPLPDELATKVREVVASLS